MCGTALGLIAAIVLIVGPSAGATTTGGTRLWTQRYRAPHDFWDQPNSVAASPDGSRVFVTGVSLGNTTSYDYVTAAYEAATGTRLWLRRYNGLANGRDWGFSVAVSPDGSKVFVTGSSEGSTSGSDYATVAYDAATGTRLWVSRYNGPTNGGDGADSVAVSPDGSKVFVTGGSTGITGRSDATTIAYAPKTGTELWVSRYNGPANGGAGAASVAASPDGSKVFVTGSTGFAGESDYATEAYNASTGTMLWVRRYKGPRNDDDAARSIVPSPDGSKVFVTGSSTRSIRRSDYATVAYDASTGNRLWVRRYNGPLNRSDEATSVAASPDGSKVYVTGYSFGTTSRRDYATIAYDASTGTTLWFRRYNGPGNDRDEATSVAASPDGSKVFVTGLSQTTGSIRSADYATVAYAASTGTPLWVRRYNGGRNHSDVARSIAPSPDGSKVFVTGISGRSYATVAYTA